MKYRSLAQLCCLLLLLLSSLAGCSGGTYEEASGSSEAAGQGALQTVSLAAGQRLAVVATTNIVGDVVRQVGGDQIDLTVLMGTGVDPHTYVPTPADTAAIHDAHVVFANGVGLEAGLEEILHTSGGSDPIVYLSDGLDLLEATAHEHEGAVEHVADEHETDPHVWFSPANVMAWVETIRQTLGTLDPGRAGDYEANARAYTRRLEELDAWVKEQIAQIPEANRKLVTSHPAFGYFGARYGLEQVGAVYPISPASEPSARDLAALEDAIRHYGVPAVFTENTVSPKLAEQVAADTGIALVPLFTGSLGGPGSGVESYIDLIRYDTSAIVQALR